MSRGRSLNANCFWSNTLRQLGYVKSQSISQKSAVLDLSDTRFLALYKYRVAHTQCDKQQAREEAGAGLPVEAGNSIKEKEVI